VTQTTNWTLTAGQSLTRSYMMLGQLNAPDYTMTPFQLAQGLTVQNGILQGLQVDGGNVFRQTPTTLIVSAGVATVPVPNDVLGIEEARWVQSPTFDRVLGRFQWVQYFQLPNKNAVGPPAIFMFDYQRDSTQLYAWPVSPVSGSINCTTLRRALNVAAIGDIIDLPAEWQLGFQYIVADALMDDQGMAEMDPATADRIKQHAAFWRAQLESFDRPTSVFLQPWGKSRRQYYRR
jgi:hypothetical protein